VYVVLTLVLWFSLDKCQLPTKAVPSLAPPAEKGRKNMMNGLWVKIRTGRDHSPITITDNTD